MVSEKECWQMENFPYIVDVGEQYGCGSEKCLGQINWLAKLESWER